MHVSIFEQELEMQFYIRTHIKAFNPQFSIHKHANQTHMYSLRVHVQLNKASTFVNLV